VTFDFKPVRLWKLVKPAPGEEPPGPRASMSKRKSNDYQNSVRHWSQLCDAPISPDARQYMKSDTALALRAALVAKEAGRFREFHDPMYCARWAEPADPADRSLIHRLLDEAGLDADAAMERADSAEIGERLERDTDEAIARGVFGVPTIFVGDEMFWGNDRFELVRHHLIGGPHD